MKKEIISSRQFISIMALFIMGSSLIIGINPTAKQNSWFSFLLATIACIPIYLLYARITQLNPEQSLFDYLPKLFGKFFGGIITFFFTFYAIHLGALVFNNFTVFMQAVIMPETPQGPVLFILLLTTLYMAKSGIETLGRWSVLILAFIVFIILFTIVFSAQHAQFSNLKPFFVTDYKTFFQSVMQSIAFPIAEVVLVLGVMEASKKQDNKYKIFFWTLAISFILLEAVVIRNTTVLGVPMMTDSYFSSYLTARLINIGDFLTRLEGSIVINFILSGIAKITICILAASGGFQMLFGFKDKKSAIVPVGLLMVTLSSVLYKNIIEMMSFIQVYVYYASIFQLFIPLLIWIFSEVKHRKQKQGGSQKAPQEKQTEYEMQTAQNVTD